jgi:hypothetical protein
MAYKYKSLLEQRVNELQDQVKAAEAENKRLREINDILDAKLDSSIIVNCQALACSAPVAAEVERLRAQLQTVRTDYRVACEDFNEMLDNTSDW